MTKRALIFWGGWDGHTPEQTAHVLAGMLRTHGAEVTLAHGTSILATDRLEQFDLIVPMVTMSVIEKSELTALCAAVRAGTGLAGAHGMMCDAFRAETEYQFMTGGQWVSHPGNIIDYTVNISAPADPVMAGISDFAYRSEQYYMHVDPANQVLATTTFTGDHLADVAGVVMPVVWKRHYGAGRVFYSALGHMVDEFAHPHMATIIERGMLWAMR